MSNPEIRSMFSAVGKDHILDPAVLAAIGQNESGGVVTTPVLGRDEPLIRFEGHYFDMRLSTGDQAKPQRARQRSGSG